MLLALAILHIEKPDSEMSIDLSGLTQLAADWPSTPSLEFRSPAQLLLARPQLPQAPAPEGTRTNIYSESGLAMAQTHKCLIVLATAVGTGKASGTACLCHSLRRGLTVGEWTPRSNSHTWMDPRRAGRAWGWGPPPGSSQVQSMSLGLREHTKLACLGQMCTGQGMEVGDGALTQTEEGRVPLSPARTSRTWVLESERTRPQFCIFCLLTRWSCVVSSCNVSVPQVPDL